jgi:hypothetical protein
VLFRSISRIQARRGLQQDLPQLASAELGWSVDQRRLFIGNGTLTEGAPTEGVTEILTQYTNVLNILKSYTFSGNAGGYTAQTGPSIISPIVRTVQDKLDDFVNVKDFGAIGDGIADDTAAINRAITQIYLSARLAAYPQVRRTLYFPAGTYKITGNILLIPPYVRMIGDGISNTFIKQTDGTQTCLLQFTDSLYQTGALLGTSGATLPTGISIEQMTLQNDTSIDKDIVIIDSATYVTFDRVAFVGGMPNQTTNGSNQACARIKSFATVSHNINFLFCNFINQRFAIYSIENSRNVTLLGCYVSGMYRGIELGTAVPTPGNVPTHYRVTGTEFASVYDHAVLCNVGAVGFLSSGNHYMDVGNHFGGSGSPAATVLQYFGGGCFSLGDSFDRNDADNAVFLRIDHGYGRSISLHANVGAEIGTLTIGTGARIVLLDNQPTPVSTGIFLKNSGMMQYSILRGGYRYGTITCTFSGGVAAYHESFTTTAAGTPGIVFTVSNSGEVFYTSTATGTAPALSYSITYF